MSRLLTILVAVSIMMTASIAAIAQGDYTYPHKGAMNANFSYSYQDVEDVTMSTFTGRGSYFVNDPFAVELGLNYLNMEEDEEEWEYTYLTIGAKYYFLSPEGNKSMSPYVGARFHYIDIQDSNDADGYSVCAGLDYFVSDNISITPELEWAQLSGTNTVDSIGFKVGITCWFN